MQSGSLWAGAVLLCLSGRLSDGLYAVCQRLNISEVFTPPKAKLLFITYSVSMWRPEPGRESASPPCRYRSICNSSSKHVLASTA